MASKLYDWFVSKIAKISPKKPKNGPFGVSIFSKAVCTNWTKFSAVIQRYIRVLYVQWHENTMTGMWKTLPKIARNWLKTGLFRLFWLSQILFLRFERNFLQSLWESLMCNDIEIEWLGCEKFSAQLAKNSHFLTFSIFSKNLDTLRTKFSPVIFHYSRVLYVQWH